MFGNSKQMVLSENKATRPRYSLSYRRGGMDKPSKKLSYDIISCLVRDRDLLLEINSSLFIDLSPNEKEKIFEGLVVGLRDLNIDYRYSQHTSPKKRKILGVSISLSQMDTEHQLLIYVPNYVWLKDEFWEFLPDYGVTYNVLSRNTDGMKLLEDIHSGRFMDKEIQEHYEATIFDYFSFGQMGIDTKLSKGELEECINDLNKREKQEIR
jgi:hypothetical protein